MYSRLIPRFFWDMKAKAQEELGGSFTPEKVKVKFASLAHSRHPHVYCTPSFVHCSFFSAESPPWWRVGLQEASGCSGEARQSKSSHWELHQGDSHTNTENHVKLQNQETVEYQCFAFFKFLVVQMISHLSSELVYCCSERCLMLYINKVISLLLV